MPVILECLSPTPLHGYVNPKPEVVDEVTRMSVARGIHGVRKIR